MTKIFTIVIILLLSFSRIYAETINNEPIEIWSEDQVNDLNEVDNSKTADSEQSHIDSSSTISQAKIEISKNLSIIQTCVMLAPLFGLLGTVTGMIEVFQVMAFNGGGDARAMAGGVSKATLPTMAGMVVALSGVFASIYLNSASEKHKTDLNEIIKREI